MTLKTTNLVANDHWLSNETENLRPALSSSGGPLLKQEKASKRFLFWGSDLASKLAGLTENANAVLQRFLENQSLAHTSSFFAKWDKGVRHKKRTSFLRYITISLKSPLYAIWGALLKKEKNG